MSEHGRVTLINSTSRVRSEKCAAQAARMETPEKRKADALASVAGFASHISDAIRNTPAEGVSRSRIVDRCAQ